MLLGRFLHSPIHLPRFDVYKLITRTLKTNGLQTTNSSSLHRPDNASTAANTMATEREPQEIPLFAHVGQVEIQAQSNSYLQKSGAKPGQSLQTHINEQILQRKLKRGHPAAIERAATFIIDNDPEYFQQSTQDLLLKDHVLRALSLPTLQTVLSFFKAQGRWLSEFTLGRIVRRLVSPEQEEDIVPLLLLLQPHILHHLREVPPADTHSISYTPPPIIQTSLVFTHALLRVDQEQAISVFRILVDAKCVPPAAIADSSSTQSLEQVIDMSLVKASLYWNCYDVSETILSHVLHYSLTPGPFVIRTTIDCLYTLLASPSQSGLDACLNIMRYLHPHAPIPDSLIRQFYERAADINAMPAAEALYSFSRNPRADLYHHYPPPQGRALSKLMFYSAAESRHDHLVRRLASEAVEGRLSVPLNDRARFIHAIARKGIASSTRALWELYASGKDGSVVYGDSGLMVRMVSLFTDLVQRLECREANLEADNSGDGQVVETSDAVQSFVGHVMSKFREHHEPWKDADHRVITSFARACFIVGKNTEGFDIFRVLLERLELPDLHDVNVALSALAGESPRAAAGAIKKMEMHGLQPDSVTFGTVLHHASVQNCQEVVIEMIERVMGTEALQSDAKVLGALIRALVQPKQDDDRDSRILKLQTVWKLICQIPTQQVPIQIGNYLVSLALEAQDAALAYKFWNVLLRGRAEYDDLQQYHQRNSIILLAEEQNKREEISGGFLKLICTELKKRDF